MARSCSEAQKRIFMKLIDFDQNLAKWQKSQNFHFEEVRFPDTKSRSDCFPHLRIEVSFAPESMEIVLDTYKVHFGWLEAAVKLKSEYWWNWSILTKICEKNVFFCSKVWLIKPPENFLLVLETCSGYLKGVPRWGECSALRFIIVRHIHRTLSEKTSGGTGSSTDFVPPRDQRVNPWSKLRVQTTKRL